MHSDIIDEILEVEENADAIIENAEKQARDIIFKAQGEKRDMVARAVEKQRAENDRLFGDAERLLRENLDSYEEERSRKNGNDADVDESVIENAASRITDILLGV